MRKSQTATEYLIILAVVIVIALVVVNTMGGFPGIGAGTNKKVSDLKLSTDTIGIESYNIGTDSSLFKLKNNYYDTVTITSFRVNLNSNLTCNSSNTNPALPVVLNIGQSMLINCSVVNSSNYAITNKQTPVVGITYTDNLGATRSAGNDASYVPVISNAPQAPAVDPPCGDPTNPDCWSTNNDVGPGYVNWGPTSNTIGTSGDTNGSVSQATWFNAVGNNVSYPAFYACYNLEEGGHTDWYLPSKQQLTDAYGVVSDFQIDGYWSSTESSGTPGDNAWILVMYDGYPYSNGKNAPFSLVRCLR